jgi:hypothetical protein
MNTTSPFRQRWSKELLSVGPECLAGHRSFDHEGRGDTIMAQRGDESDDLPGAMRHRLDEPLTLRRSAVRFHADLLNTASPSHTGLPSSTILESDSCPEGKSFTIDSFREVLRRENLAEMVVAAGSPGTGSTQAASLRSKSATLCWQPSSIVTLPRAKIFRKKAGSERPAHPGL